MKASKLAGLLLILMGLVGLYLLRDAAPVIRLVAASFGMIWVIKLAALCWQTSDGVKFKSNLGLALYFAWPGVSVKGFTERGEILPTTGSRFLESWLSFVFGTILLVVLSLIGEGQSTILNYLGLLAILLVVHLGLIEVIADGIRLLGFTPDSLFDRPYRSASLRDFWSARWNRAFVDMNKIFIMRPLRDKLPLAVLTFSIFAVSGLLHELGISYADGVSWGSPLIYFVVQGVGMELEKHWKFPIFLVWGWIILPVPLLFTPSFTNLFVGGLGQMISGFVNSVGLNEFYRYGLLVGGIFHLLVLCASVQVPGKLGWKVEFQRLSSLNRKVFWTYGAYIFSIIIFMAMVSFLLSQQDLAAGSLSSSLWVLFIALFWWARILIDFLYMSHSDWPQGPLFSVGHVCLATLFTTMTILYSVLAFVSFGALP